MTENDIKIPPRIIVEMHGGYVTVVTFSEQFPYENAGIHIWDYDHAAEVPNEDDADDDEDGPFWATKYFPVDPIPHGERWETIIKLQNGFLKIGDNNFDYFPSDIKILMRDYDIDKYDMAKMGKAYGDPAISDDDTDHEGYTDTYRQTVYWDEYDETERQLLLESKYIVISIENGKPVDVIYTPGFPNNIGITLRLYDIPAGKEHSAETDKNGKQYLPVFFRLGG
jgi:hypothetical protein